MKRKIEISMIAAFFLLYFGGYLIVRCAFENEGNESKPDSSGHHYLPSVDYTSTEFNAPSDGVRRLWQYSLYYIFYPLGKLDSVITDRRYEIIDWRYAII